MFALLLLLFSAVAAGEPQRPAFHARPAKNWINDPNGPLYFKGRYHLFVQYNPDAAFWGNMHWAHLVSADLLRWTELPIALAPDAPYDADGVFSGSATLLADGTPALLYTGQTSKEVQCLALPADPLQDPLLEKWVKYEGNPVFVAPAGVPKSSFRDPTTALKVNSSTWVVLVGGALDGRGAALSFASEDFRAWRYIGPLLQGAMPGAMWECPDLFKVASDVWVLKSSQDKAGLDWYVLGNYDGAANTFKVIPGTLAKYDYGTAYASKSFWDSSKQRNIVWIWTTETDSVRDGLSPQRTHKHLSHTRSGFCATARGKAWMGRHHGASSRCIS